MVSVYGMAAVFWSAGRLLTRSCTSDHRRQSRQRVLAMVARVVLDLFEANDN